MSVLKVRAGILSIALITCFVVSVSADVPKVINYQGRLTDSDGNPVADGNYDLTFQIVEHDPLPMGETPLWSSGVQTVTVADGLFVYYLGSNVPLPIEIFNDDGLDSYFLRVKTEGSMLFLDGVQLVTAPFSVRSIYADTAAYAFAGPGGGSSGWEDVGSVVRLETYSDYVGIGTNSPGEPLVVGWNIGTFAGNHIVSGTPYADDISGFKMGNSSSNHTTMEWNGDGVSFALHTKHLGTNYNNSLVSHEGKVGVNMSLPSSAQLEAYSNIVTAENYDGDYDYTVAIMGKADMPGSSTEYNYACGVYGDAVSAGISENQGETYGVYGQAIRGHSAFGVVGWAKDAAINYGVYGRAQGDATSVKKAGYFVGEVSVVGTLSKSSGSFKIDHPLDPENKYLQHSFVESPDMMNVYNGNITTDANGDAEIVLPEYFESLNRDFRYQLTVIGTFAQAIVSQEIEEGAFRIKTDKPNVKVSWQVTGIRQDPWANEHRIEVEVSKRDDEKGLFLAPELYGFGSEKSVDPLGREMFKTNR